MFQILYYSVKREEMIARDYFFSDAYKHGEAERTKWEREVLEEYYNRENKAPFGLKEVLYNIFDAEEKIHSNTNIYEMIINTYLSIENNQNIKDIEKVNKAISTTDNDLVDLDVVPHTYVPEQTEGDNQADQADIGDGDAPVQVEMGWWSFVYIRFWWFFSY